MARPTRRPGEKSPQDIYQFGVQGRKTGATLNDTGKRDSQGMMPTAGLFSSPGGDDTTQKPTPAPTRQPTIPEETPLRDRNDDASVPMDIASSGGPGPQTVLRESRKFSLPLPKGRSPVKTSANSLRSPAKRPPPNMSPLRPSPAEATGTHLEHSSPTTRNSRLRRPSGIDNIPSDNSMTDLLNQSRNNDDHAATRYQAANIYGSRSRSPQIGLGMSDKAKGKQRAVRSRSPEEPAGRNVSPPRMPSPPPQFPDEPETPLYVTNSESSSDPEPLQPLPSPSPPPQLRELSNPKPAPEPTTQKRPTPAVSTAGSAARRSRELDDERRDGAKRPKQAESVVSRRSEQPVKRGRGRPPKNGVAKRGRGRPRKSEVESDGEGDSLMTLQRGPPMPKSRGLVSMRRDTTVAVNQRGGNDANWWADVQDRQYESELRPGQRITAKIGTKQRHPLATTVAEDELEDWEIDPGSITGEIVLWEPEHEDNPPGPDDPVQVTDERVAITAEAIQTFEIRDSDARYAKPLTMPFMGAGLVDLPPGSEKRPKNSRKMHLVFFVHYGKVTVSINELQFRISAGGMWFVPRGNYYNIANDDELPARVYFAQACEVSASSQPLEDMTQTIMA